MKTTCMVLGLVWGLAWAPGAARAQTPAEAQVIMTGYASRAASLTTGSERAVYVFWDEVEQQLAARLLPAGTRLELRRDGVTVTSFAFEDFGVGEVMSASDIDLLYAGATQARRKAETMAALDRMFADGANDVDGLPADLTVSPATFSLVLHDVLADPARETMATVLGLLDPNVAMARYRAFVDPLPEGASGARTYTLVAHAPAPSGATRELGQVVVDTGADFRAGPASAFRSVTEAQSRCDVPSLRGHGAVALTWDHPGIPSGGNSALERMLSSLVVAGYDLYRAPGPCSAPVDLRALAAAASPGADGTFTLAGLARVNAAPITISSPAPAFAVMPPEVPPDGAPVKRDKARDWWPAFAQTLELPDDLGAAGLGPGDAVCYHLVARDKSGNYGDTVMLDARVADLVKPETPWMVEAIAESTAVGEDVPAQDRAQYDALYLEWPHVTWTNWLAQFGGLQHVCNAAGAAADERAEALATPGPDAAACADPGKTRTVRLDVTRYLVYRFDTYEEAVGFVDSDGDGLPDPQERLVDTNGDGTPESIEASVSAATLAQSPVPGPGRACEAAPAPFMGELVEVIDVAAEPARVVLGPGGRTYVRFVDRTPSAAANKSEVYWYTIAPVARDGRVGRATQPIRALFPQDEKPEPFVPGVDLTYQACGPTGFQDDSPHEGERDTTPPAGEYEPIVIVDEGIERHVLGVDYTGAALGLRVSCLDEAMLARAEEPGASEEDVRAAIDMRMGSWVGDVRGVARIEPQDAAAFGYTYPEPAPDDPPRYLFATGDDYLQTCAALTERAYGRQFFCPGGIGEGCTVETVQRCTPYVEFLDGNGRRIGDPVRIDVRPSYDDCDADPLLPSCATYACGFIATQARRCEAAMDPVSIVSDGFEIGVELDEGECIDVEMTREIPRVVDLGGGQTRVEHDIETYRADRRCCMSPGVPTYDAAACGALTIPVTPPSGSTELTCYSAARAHTTAGGKGNSATATRTPGPCVRRVQVAGAPATPPAPRVVSFAPPPDGLNATLTWSVSEVPVAGAIVEWWKEGDATSRRSRYVSSLGRQGPLAPIITNDLALGALLPQGQSEQWCVQARAVGVGKDVGGQAPLSPVTAPLCAQRTRAPVTPGIEPYIEWPAAARPTLLDAGAPIEVDYLWRDGVPFVRLGTVDDPLTVPEADGDCATAGCLPNLVCSPHGFGPCLSRLRDQHPGTPPYFWSEGSAVVESTVADFCQTLAPHATKMTNMVVYRQSRDTGTTTPGPFVQASEHIARMHCLFSRTAWEDLAPPKLSARGARYGPDDPHFEVLWMTDRDDPTERVVELVFLDRHPHVAGKDYRYQFVYFDERGAIAAYRQSKWLVYHGMVATGSFDETLPVWLPEGTTP